MEGRLKALEFIFLGVLLVIVGRLVDIQIIRSDHYRALATGRSEGNSRAEGRGNIYFQSSGEPVIAATERVFYTVAITPRTITESDTVYAHVKRFFPIERAAFDAKMKKNNLFEIIARRIDQEKKSEIENGAPSGVVFVAENLRYYPGDATGAHVLGFVGEDEDGLKGRYGAEQYFDDMLRAGGSQTPPDAPWWKDVFFRSFADTEKGNDVVLTIESPVQTTTEEILSRTLEKWNSRKGGIIVVDPSTGRIIAMAARPTFNPNAYYETKDSRTFLNPNIQNLFEVGSVMKTLTMASAIDRHAVTPQTIYHDTGSREIDGYNVKNFDGKARGDITVTQALMESLNMGAVFAVERLGTDTFREYLESFGLGEISGVTLAGELPGNIENLHSPRLLEYATASFGQGISVTPLQITMAVSAIANGGWLLEPFIVDKIRTPNGTTLLDGERKVRHQVVTEEATRAVTTMMVKFVDERLVGGKIPGYSVAVKTGTAEIPNEETRGYSDELLHTYIGFAPAYDPKFLIFLYMERPQGVRYSSQSLTPPFRELMQFLLSYYNIKPDRVCDKC